MTQNRMNQKKILTGVWSLAIIIYLLFTCERPGLEMADDHNTISKTGRELINPLNIVFYPSNEIYYHENFALFCTTIVIPSISSNIGSFDFSLLYDSKIVQFESINSQKVINLSTVESEDQLLVKAENISISAGNNLELFTITWKAVSTAITDITVQINSLKDINGLPIEAPEKTMGTVKIVKKAGSISVNGPQSIKVKGTFSSSIHINSGETVIKEYDMDISYDPNKLSLANNVQDFSLGPDGFFNTIDIRNGKINVTGTSVEGKGPGKDLDFLNFKWLASQTGKTTIAVTINKMKTLDDVYIKPETKNLTISIYSDNKKPVFDIHFDPATTQVTKDGSFMTKIVLNTEGYALAAYGFDIQYDPDILEIDKNKANGSGIEAGKDGFMNAFNPLNPGLLKVVGFDLYGRSSKLPIELLNIYWKAKKVTNTSEIKLSVQSLADVRSKNIDLYRVSNCIVTVQE